MKYIDNSIISSSDESKSFIINRLGTKAISGLDMNNNKKAVVDYRDTFNSDKGMIDIFNVDKIKEIKKNIVSILNHIRHEKFKCLFSNTKFTITHLYFNKSIRLQSTRRLHYDNLRRGGKIFIYLTDVLHNEDGPYCYVPGSHRLAFLQFLNTLYNNIIGYASVKGNACTDSTWVNKNLMLPIKGDKGTIIISNQTGIHRGLPQKADTERIALVQVLSFDKKYPKIVKPFISFFLKVMAAILRITS